MPEPLPHDRDLRELRSLDEVVSGLESLIHGGAVGPAAADAVATANGRHRLLVGIAGSPGSGKSTIGAMLVERLNAVEPRAVLLPMDGFHLPQARLVMLGRRDRMGAPDTFDVGGFITRLHALRAAGPEPVLVPGFDREIEEPVPDAMSIPATASIVVVEGNYLLMQSGGWQHVLPLLDVSYFVELDRDIRLERLIARHERFGKSPDAARSWALGPDEANARLIEESAAQATHRIRLP